MLALRSAELDHAGIKRALSPRPESSVSLQNERPATAPTSFLKRPKTVAKGLSIFNLVRQTSYLLIPRLKNTQDDKPRVAAALPAGLFDRAMKHTSASSNKIAAGVQSSK